MPFYVISYFTVHFFPYTEISIATQWMSFCGWYLIIIFNVKRKAELRKHWHCILAILSLSKVLEGVPWLKKMSSGGKGWHSGLHAAPSYRKHWQHITQNYTSSPFNSGMFNVRKIKYTALLAKPICKCFEISLLRVAISLKHITEMYNMNHSMSWLSLLSSLFSFQQIIFT